ncbi:hypothetical protein ACT4R9_01695 [Ornithobacterium rhinotracheale]|uniref:hypothetical protein n=1 Tax=Ornithobacterium rhinotracheale TaxID=28251 RepID=UPI003FA49E5A
MKIKHTILLLLLADLSFAQINTNQKITEKSTSSAFLDASENGENFAPDVGRGLLFPQTDLSKFNLDIDAADGINYPTYFDGMIVYNTQEGGATNDPNLNTQTENLTKGFYYFSNPKGKDNESISEGKWVKLGDSKAIDKLWAQRDNGGVTETYLKPALNYNDVVAYGGNKYFRFDIGRVGEQDDENKAPFYIASSSLKFNESKNDKSSFSFNKMFSLVENTHASKHTNVYAGVSSRVLAKGISTPIERLTSYYAQPEYKSNSFVNELIGGYFQPILREDGSADFNISYVGSPQNYGYSGTLTAFVGNVLNYGKADRIRGIYNWVRSQVNDQGDPKPHVVKILRGQDNDVHLVKNGKLEGWSHAAMNSFILEKGSSLKDEIRVYGEENLVSINGDYSFSNNDFMVSNQTFRMKESGDKAKNVFLSRIAVNSDENNASIDNLYGFFYSSLDRSKWNGGSIYGIYLEKINNGTIGNYGLFVEDVKSDFAQKNYAIYTGLGKVRFGDSVGIGVDAPTEKLEVEGAVKLSATKNDCTQANRGTIKFENDNFYGCKSTGWVKLNP